MAEPFEVDLMHDTASRRDDPHIGKGAAGPLDQPEALAVALHFQAAVHLQSFSIACEEHIQRMVDDKIDRDRRVKSRRITALIRQSVTHRRHIGDQRYTHKVLQQSALRCESDWVRCITFDQRRDLHPRLGNRQAIKNVLSQYADRTGLSLKASDIGGLKVDTFGQSWADRSKKVQICAGRRRYMPPRCAILVGSVLGGLHFLSKPQGGGRGDQGPRKKRGRGFCRRLHRRARSIVRT